MGCALLKVQLREPLTCLELETAWALAKRRPEVSGPPPLLPRRLQGCEKRGVHLGHRGARIHSFGVKPLPPGLASARAPSCPSFSPRFGFIRAGDEEGDPRPAWAPLALSSLCFSAFGASLPTPTSNFLPFPFPLPHSAPSKVKARCVHLCPSSTVKPTGSIAEGSEAADSQPVSPFDFPAPPRYAMLTS